MRGFREVPGFSASLGPGRGRRAEQLAGQLTALAQTVDPEAAVIISVSCAADAQDLTTAETTEISGYGEDLAGMCAGILAQLLDDPDWEYRQYIAECFAEELAQLLDGRTAQSIAGRIRRHVRLTGPQQKNAGGGQVVPMRRRTSHPH